MFFRKKKKIDEIKISIDKSGEITFAIDIDSSDPRSIEQTCAAIYAFVNGQLNKKIYEYLQNHEDPQIARMSSILDAVARLGLENQANIENLPIVHPFAVFGNRQK